MLPGVEVIIEVGLCGQDHFFSGLELLAEDTAPSAAVRCCIFPALCVDVHGLHVVFADIFEALLQAANSSLAKAKFAVEDALGYMATLHLGRYGQAIAACVVCHLGWSCQPWVLPDAGVEAF